MARLGRHPLDFRSLDVLCKDAYDQWPRKSRYKKEDIVTMKIKIRELGGTIEAAKRISEYLSIGTPATYVPNIARWCERYIALPQDEWEVYITKIKDINDDSPRKFSGPADKRSAGSLNKKWKPANKSL